ncbi:hypothetical protein THAOC_28818, partial [Thalassiosira oceanica]
MSTISDPCPDVARPCHFLSRQSQSRHISCQDSRSSHLRQKEAQCGKRRSSNSQFVKVSEEQSESPALASRATDIAGQCTFVLVWLVALQSQGKESGDDVRRGLRRQRRAAEEERRARVRDRETEAGKRAASSTGSERPRGTVGRCRHRDCVHGRPVPRRHEHRYPRLLVPRHIARAAQPGAHVQTFRVAPALVESELVLGRGGEDYCSSVAMSSSYVMKAGSHYAEFRFAYEPCIGVARPMPGLGAGAYREEFTFFDRSF